MSDESEPPTDGDVVFRDLPVAITVVIGTATPPVAEVLSLRRDSVVPLNSQIDDPVAIFVGDKLIAHGELQTQEDGTGLSVRITSIPGKPVAS
ncbi:MAG: FliM/FliN family flagellar motor switch protein [Pseudomonadota bacterium]